MSLDQTAGLAATQPFTLQRLLDTHQATPILPGLLYFATTGECLSSFIAETSSAPETSTKEGSYFSASGHHGGAPWLTTALQNFFLKENPSTDKRHRRHEAPETTAAAVDTAAVDVAVVPATSAAVGCDAVFVAPRTIPPYLYRPFFADFGPLDLGCCVHFARRLRELATATTGVDVGAVDGAPCGNEECKAAMAGGTTPSAEALSTKIHTTSMSVRNSTQGRDAGLTAAAPRPRLHVPSHTYPAAAQGSPPLSRSTSTQLHDGGGAASSTPRSLPVVVCASLNAQERVNTACLVGAFCILVLGWTTSETWHRVFAGIYPGFLTYRDASKGVSNYPLSLQDVWAGLEHAMHLGWVTEAGFDLASYWVGKEKDYTWIVPSRLLAMSSPQDGEPARTAEVFAYRLKSLAVRLVVRLNDDLYSTSPLSRLGIQHVDLPYPDGSVPSDATLLRFLHVVEEHFEERVTPSSSPTTTAIHQEHATGMHAKAPRGESEEDTADAKNSRHSSRTKPLFEPAGSRRRRVSHRPHKHRLEPCSLRHSGACRGMPRTYTAVPNARTAGDTGAIAVHCLAGLGRTGTMLAVYMMRHYGFTARAVIGWLRLCRPGSITGVQQQYLDAMERRLRPTPSLASARTTTGLTELLHRPAGVHAGLNQSASLSSSSSDNAVSPGAVESSRHAKGGGAGREAAAAASYALTRPTGGDMRNGGGAGQRLYGTGPVHAGGVSLEGSWPNAPLGVPAGMAAFQTHGSVVGDARPATGTNSRSPSSHRPDSANNRSSGNRSLEGEAPWVEAAATTVSGGPWGRDLQGLLIPRPPSAHQPPPPSSLAAQPRRHSNASASGSINTMSFSADAPTEKATLDMVSRMPPWRSGKEGRPRWSTVTAPLPIGLANRIVGSSPGSNQADSSGNAYVGSAGATSDNVTAAVSGGQGNEAGATTASGGAPRAGDYRYASTYFMALERASKRTPAFYNRAAPLTLSTLSSPPLIGFSPPLTSRNGGGGCRKTAARAATATVGAVRRGPRLGGSLTSQHHSVPSSGGGFESGGYRGGRTGLTQAQRTTSFTTAAVPRSATRGDNPSDSSLTATATFDANERLNASSGGLILKPRRPHTATAVTPRVPHQARSAVDRTQTVPWRREQQQLEDGTAQDDSYPMSTMTDMEGIASHDTATPINKARLTNRERATDRDEDDNNDDGSSPSVRIPVSVLAPTYNAPRAHTAPSRGAAVPTAVLPPWGRLIVRA